MESWVPYVVGVVVILLIFKNILRSSRRPKSKTFSCRRCKKTAAHTSRTIGAWRDGKTHFFCNNCHQLWLRSNPSMRHQRARSNSGCLSVIALFVALPIVFLIVVGVE